MSHFLLWSIFLMMGLFLMYCHDVLALTLNASLGYKNNNKNRTNKNISTPYKTPVVKTSCSIAEHNSNLFKFLLTFTLYSSVILLFLCEHKTFCKMDIWLMHACCCFKTKEMLSSFSLCHVCRVQWLSSSQIHYIWWVGSVLYRL